jgi:hypothetical protein
MTAKPKNPRYQGRWLASWQADIREELGELKSRVSDLQEGIVTQIASKLGELRTDTDANTQAIGGLNEKLGSSIWQAILNVAFAAGIAYALLKLHGVDIP